MEISTNMKRYFLTEFKSFNYFPFSLHVKLKPDLVNVVPLGTYT